MATREEANPFLKIWDDRVARALLRRAKLKFETAGQRISQGAAKVQKAATPIVREMAKETEKAVVGQIGLRVGRAEGAFRSVAQTREDLWNAAQFLYRFQDPYDRLKHPEGGPLSAIRDGMVEATTDIVNKAKKYAADPELIGPTIASKMKKAAVDYNPHVAPMAATAAEEFQRNRVVGGNQVEFVTDLAIDFGGAPAIRSAKLMAKAPKLTGVDRHLAEGFPLKEATRLAKPYEGKGHHWWPERGLEPIRLPNGDNLKIKLPEWLLNSPFNVSKPFGYSQGDHYRHHAEADSKFHGAAIFRGRPGWSAKKLGIEPYGVLGRVYYGMPAPTLSLAGAGLLSLIESVPEEEP